MYHMIWYVYKFDLVQMFMQTTVCRFQSANTSSRALISLSLEVVITSSKSEMSLRSNISWYNTGA